MDAVDMIKNRRSIRSFEDKVVDKEVIKEIIDISRWAPSWANYQVARYTLVTDKNIIGELSKKGVNDFIYNVDVLSNARNVAVLSYVKGKSGRLKKEIENGIFKYEDVDSSWEAFDAGIACQTFCLAAHAKGIGSVILGVIDSKEISNIIKLPKDETVAAIIVYGYPKGEHPHPTPRMEIDEIARFL